MGRPSAHRLPLLLLLLRVVVGMGGRGCVPWSGKVLLLLLLLLLLLSGQGRQRSMVGRRVPLTRMLLLLLETDRVLILSAAVPPSPTATCTPPYTAFPKGRLLCRRC